MEGLSSGKLQLDFSELEVTRHRRRLHGSDLDRQHERDASVSPGLAPSSADGVAASGNSYHNANGGAHAVEGVQLELSGAGLDIASTYGTVMRTVSNLKQQVEKIPCPAQAPGKKPSAGAFTASETDPKLWKNIKSLFKPGTKSSKTGTLTILTPEQLEALTKARPELVLTTQDLYNTLNSWKTKVDGFNRSLDIIRGKLADARAENSRLKEEGEQVSAAAAARQAAADQKVLGLEKTVARLEGFIAEGVKQRKNLQARLDEVSKELGTAKKDVSTQKTNINILETKLQGERRHVATLQSEVKQLKADTDTIIKDLNNDLKKAKQCPITLKKLEDAENANLKLTKENKALKETAETLAADNAVLRGKVSNLESQLADTKSDLANTQSALRIATCKIQGKDILLRGRAQRLAEQEEKMAEQEGVLATAEGHMVAACAAELVSRDAIISAQQAMIDELQAELQFLRGRVGQAEIPVKAQRSEDA